MASGRIREPQHAARGVVGELHAAVLVDHQHALDHAREDRFHPRAILRQLRDASAQILHGVVEDARDSGDLVAAEVADRALGSPAA